MTPNNFQAKPAHNCSGRPDVKGQEAGLQSATETARISTEIKLNRRRFPGRRPQAQLRIPGLVSARVCGTVHGFPYSIDSFVEVAPMLAARGCRVIVPYLRGHGSTHFLQRGTPRSGQQGAIGVVVIALMDALKAPIAVLTGFDWAGAPLASQPRCGRSAARAWFPSTAISSRI